MRITSLGMASVKIAVVIANVGNCCVLDWVALRRVSETARLMLTRNDRDGRVRVTNSEREVVRETFWVRVLLRRGAGGRVVVAIVGTGPVVLVGDGVAGSTEDGTTSVDVGDGGSGTTPGGSGWRFGSRRVAECVRDKVSRRDADGNVNEPLASEIVLDGDAGLVMVAVSMAIESDHTVGEGRESLGNETEARDSVRVGSDQDTLFGIVGEGMVQVLLSAKVWVAFVRDELGCQD